VTHRPSRLLALGALTALLVMVGCGSSSSKATPASSTSVGSKVGGAGNTASATGVTKDTITIGMITDLTGAGSSTFADSAQGAAARFALQNAEGGVDGRRLVLDTADSTSTAPGAQLAARDLVGTKHVFGVIGIDVYTSGAAPYLNKAGIPVTGSDLDGPEWFEQPNTNMFNIEGTQSPKYPSFTQYGLFWKATGAKKVSVLASDTPSSTSQQKQEENSIKAVGLSNCDDQVVPLGGVDFTSYALSFKSAGCDAVGCSCVLSSSLAVSTALKQLGLTNVKVDYDAGPSQGVYATPQALTAANNAYFEGTTIDPSFTSAGSKTLLAALHKYDPNYKGGIPDLGVTSGYLAADLMIKGLEVAGSNPTRQSFISDLRKVSNFDGSGILPAPVSFVNFGQAPAKSCLAYAQFVDKKYVPFPSSRTPFCGTLIPNSNAATSSPG
jgi:branched-chain amino acid transport system substrate-binding protein